MEDFVFEEGYSMNLQTFT